MSSWPTDFASRSVSTGRSSIPRASPCRCSPCAPKDSHQRLPRRAAQISDRPDPPSQERLPRHLPHPPQLPHRKRVQEILLSAGRNDREAVRLPEIRRDLRQELVRRHAGGDGQPRLFPDRRLDLPRHLFRGAEQPLAPRDVEERLVDGERLDQGGEPAVDGEDRVGHLPVARHADGQEDPLRAEPLRRRRRHRRVDAGFARLVRCGRHDAATLVTAHDHRLSTELRAIEHLYRCVESVEIQVQDAPHRMVDVHFREARTFRQSGRGTRAAFMRTPPGDGRRRRPPPRAPPPSLGRSPSPRRSTSLPAPSGRTGGSAGTRKDRSSRSGRSRGR